MPMQIYRALLPALNSPFVFSHKMGKIVLAVWEAVKGYFHRYFHFHKAPSLEHRAIQQLGAPIIVPQQPVAAHAQLSLSAEMKQAANEIVGLYEEILRDPRKARLSEGDRLTADLKVFRTHYGADIARVCRSGAEETDLAVKTINAVEAAERSMIYLRCLKCFLLLKKEPAADQVGEIRVPGDGNCLYHSFLLGLDFCHLALPSITTDMTLRRGANEWLNKHKGKPEVQEFLNEAIASYVDARKMQLNIERESESAIVNNAEALGVAEQEIAASLQALGKIEGDLRELDQLDIPLYLTLAAQDKFFGTIAEIYALSKLYNVSIKVKYLVAGREFDERTFNPGQPKMVILRYKVGASHFDAQAFEEVERDS